MDSSPDRAKRKTIKLVFVASPLSMQYKGERTKNHDNVSECFFQSVRTIKSGIVQSGYRYHHLIENKLVLAMIQLKNCRVRVKQQSLTQSNFSCRSE